MLRHPSLSLYQPCAFPHHSTRRTPGGSSADSGPASLSPAAESLGTSPVAPPAGGEPEPSGRVYMGAIIAEGPWGPGASRGWGLCWGGGGMKRWGEEQSSTEVLEARRRSCTEQSKDPAEPPLLSMRGVSHSANPPPPRTPHEEQEISQTRRQVMEDLEKRVWKRPLVQPHLP